MSTKIFTSFFIALLLSMPAWAQPSRLIAESHYTLHSAAFPTADSVTYNYSGTRGGDLKHTLKYDSLKHYGFGSIQPGRPVPSDSVMGISSRTYDTLSNLLAQEDDFYSHVTSSFQPYSLVTYTYDANNNMTSSISQMWDTATFSWQNGYKHLYQYDGSNHLVMQVNQNWVAGSGIWANTSADSFTYSSTGKMLAHILQYWNAGWLNNMQYVYTYDASNNNTSRLQQSWHGGAWTYGQQDFYSYSSGNDMLSALSVQWNNTGTACDTLTLQAYTYNSTHDKITELDQYWQSGWNNSASAMYSYDGNHNLVVDSLQKWDNTTSTFINTQRDLFTYNSYNQLLTQVTENWNGSGWGGSLTGGHEDDYYYEPYTTGVATLGKAIEGMSLFPSPADNIISITIKWSHPQQFIVGVYDIQGRLLQQVGHVATAYASITLPVSQLPVGNYFIKVTAADGTIAKQFVINR